MGSGGAAPPAVSPLFIHSLADFDDTVNIPSGFTRVSPTDPADPLVVSVTEAAPSGVALLRYDPVTTGNSLVYLTFYLNVTAVPGASGLKEVLYVRQGGSAICFLRLNEFASTTTYTLYGNPGGADEIKAAMNVGQTYKIQAEINLTSNVVKYYVDGVLEFTGNAGGLTLVDQLRICNADDAGLVQEHSMYALSSGGFYDIVDNLVDPGIIDFISPVSPVQLESTEFVGGTWSQDGVQDTNYTRVANTTEVDVGDRVCLETEALTATYDGPVLDFNGLTNGGTYRLVIKVRGDAPNLFSTSVSGGFDQNLTPGDSTEWVTHTFDVTLTGTQLRLFFYSSWTQTIGHKAYWKLVSLTQI